ncbi:type II toxin-antitoxin system RelE/ParE family toxin [Escherichia albertii]|nr:type II toxin-antitoxin system RelE/ParE family toxin [Escherichia albertii]
MRYQVKFREDALKEWQKLDKAIQQQFAKKLKKCCDNPHIPSAKLRGIKDCYKIKFRASGFRLVYQVIDEQLIIAVVAVGKRGAVTFIILPAKEAINTESYSGVMR